MKNYCQFCVYFKPYYLKGIKKFDKTDVGLCKYRQRTVDARYDCRHFIAAIFRADTRDATLKAIFEHIDVLEQIKQILLDDQEMPVDLQFMKEANEIHGDDDADVTPK